MSETDVVVQALILLGNSVYSRRDLRRDNHLRFFNLQGLPLYRKMFFKMLVVNPARERIPNATAPLYRDTLAGILQHVRAEFPALVPKHTLIRMIPGAIARVGCVKGHISEEIMEKRVAILCPTISGDKKRILRDHLHATRDAWPLEIKPAEDSYFSQHDLCADPGVLFVPEQFREMSFADMETNLVRLKNIIFNSK